MLPGESFADKFDDEIDEPSTDDLDHNCAQHFQSDRCECRFRNSDNVTKIHALSSPRDFW